MTADRPAAGAADDPELCANCSGPLSFDEQVLRERRICDECAESYAIDEWEAQR